VTHAIRVHETGGPEVLRWEPIDVGAPGEGEIRVRHTAVGLNFIDVYFRTGLYSAGSSPFVLGVEAAGVVEEAGDGVTEVSAGDRIAYAAQPVGAYSQERLIPASQVVKVPDAIDDHSAAAMMLKGMTAEYLLRRTFSVGANTTLLFHAAAGGVGLIACQWAKALGATVIGTVGSAEKAQLARAHGCDHPLIHGEDDLATVVKDLTSGRGVDVVYDSIGRDTFMASLDCLRPLGMMVSFGQSSGPMQSIDVGMLAAKGSLFLTRPTLFTYIAERGMLVESANALFDVIAAGQVGIEVNQTFPLADAADAHRALEGRQTTGSTVLLP